MHVKVCPRLSLMYAIPLVFGLWSEYSDYSDYSEYSDYSDYSEYSDSLFKKEGMPESTPSIHLKPIPRYQALGPAYLVFLI
jgi:hypothetical protein